MRGCLLKVKPKTKPRPGTPKGEFTWRIILALGRGTDGKHKQKWVTFHGTRKQAEQKLVELTGEVHRGEFVEPSKVTVGAWLEEWLEKAIRPPRCTPNTYRSYCGIVKNHLKPALGHILLQHLSILQVERYYTDCREKLAERSVAMHHALLTTALNAAVTAGLLRHNVAKRTANKPKIRMSDDALRNVWNADEAHRFLDTVKSTKNAQLAALFAVALDGGLRKSELLGLQWKDLQGATLRVERQLLGVSHDDAGVYHLDTSLPKGKRARSLDLSDETVALLREHRRQQAELKLKNRLRYIDQGLVFAQEWEHQNGKHSRLGLPLCRSTVHQQLARLCVKSGVKQISAHGLRHTCATLLMQAGVPPVVVQKRLGHADAAMTLNVYSHVLPSMQKDAAARLATLLHG